MKIAAIKKCCLDRGRVTVLHTPEGCWISDGVACWPTCGITICAENIPELFDLNQKQIEKIEIEDAEINDERISVLPCLGERVLKHRGYVWYAGDLFAVLEHVDGSVRLLEARELKPTQSGETQFTLRGEGERDLVAVFGDLMVCAIITPIGEEKTRQILEAVQEITRRRETARKIAG